MSSMWKVPPAGLPRAAAATTDVRSGAATGLAHARRGGTLAAVDGEERLRSAPTAILLGSKPTTDPLRRMMR
jgi:hypothetical protein